MCKCCNGNHGVWKCDEFQKLTVNKRWDTRKRLQLCYRCLGHDHVGRQCPRSRACNLDGCKEVHNRLLHRDKQSLSEPKVPRPTVDMLIGLDYPDLHYSYRDIRGKPGEPIARLTPLGWTCIGDPNSGQDQTLFNRTYFARGQENRNDLDNIVRKFWEIENVKTPSEKRISKQ
ncbi:unnamed protein product [Mytilus edulis]|uniref:CCHC-type domain-containing protein n=1 Tax=Mytilus edulis TaxID=6550 RepID=A0A8S3RXV5_MYTED|nr:unnamed protein product [Mytilus edulis]